VSELRGRGFSYQGIPVPWEALEIRPPLETRAGETIAGGIFVPKFIAPVIERLFAASVAARMGANVFNVVSGNYEIPVMTGAITAGWATTELGNVSGPIAGTTASRTLTPSNTLGVQIKLSRKAMLQAGPELESAMRRDVSSTVMMALDQAAFLGIGSSGQPLGIVFGQATYAYATAALAAAPTYDLIRTAIAAFMTANAAQSPADILILMRPETYSKLDSVLFTNTAVSSLAERSARQYLDLLERVSGTNR
jgi:HK97 family phage major capsid protein